LKTTKILLPIGINKQIPYKITKTLIPQKRWSLYNSYYSQKIFTKKLIKKEQENLRKKNKYVNLSSEKFLSEENKKYKFLDHYFNKNIKLLKNVKPVLLSVFSRRIRKYKKKNTKTYVVRVYIA